MYFKARVRRGWTYRFFFLECHTQLYSRDLTLLLLVIQANRFSLSTDLTNISATAPGVSLTAVFFYYMSYIFTFTSARRILILVIPILLYSSQGLHCQGFTNSLGQQNWSINRRGLYSTRLNASKYTLIKNYHGT